MDDAYDHDDDSSDRRGKTGLYNFIVHSLIKERIEDTAGTQLRQQPLCPRPGGEDANSLRDIFRQFIITFFEAEHKISQNPLDKSFIRSLKLVASLDKRD